MNRLDRSIKQFRVDAQRFLVGDLHVPPEELRESIATSLKRLRNDARGVAENFRLNSLEAKFNSQVDLYNRKMRRREEGESRAVAAKSKAPDPREGVVVGQAGAGNAVEVLYKGLFLEKGNRKPSMDLEKFRSYIHHQADVIRSKTGCSDIHFRVAVEDGKMKIKAKPVKSQSQ